jgi:hypothetical protein
MSASSCSFIVCRFPVSFTTCFGLHGHLQVCRIPHIFIFCLESYNKPTNISHAKINAEFGPCSRLALVFCSPGFVTWQQTRLSLVLLKILQFLQENIHLRTDHDVSSSRLAQMVMENQPVWTWARTLDIRPFKSDHDSSVGTVGLRAGQPGFYFRQCRIFLFSTASRLALGPTETPI